MFSTSIVDVRDNGRGDCSEWGFWDVVLGDCSGNTSVIVGFGFDIIFAL